MMAEIVVQDGQGHIDISTLYPYKVFCNLVVMKIGLTYPRPTNSAPSSVVYI